MTLSLRQLLCRVALAAFCCGAFISTAAAQYVQPQKGASFVPGSGYKVTQVGDDFEDEKWEFYPAWPKSSQINDGDQRLPAGMSKNSRVYESTYRGQPDIVRRVPTPPGGIPGSKGALLMRTVHSGIPGAPSNDMQQDDLLINVVQLLGGFVPLQWTPSVVTRVWIPDFKVWEKRTGSSFGFRLELEGVKQTRGGYHSELYWPGFFVQFNRKADGHPEDHAVLLIRGDVNGHELPGPKITKGDSWWTLGMTVTPNGAVHYFAHEGVEPLTEKDLIASQYPYGFRATKLNTFFYNVVNWDNGRTQSTPWIIDDPELWWHKAPPPAPLVDKTKAPAAKKPVEGQITDKSKSPFATSAPGGNPAAGQGWVPSKNAAPLATKPQDPAAVPQPVKQ